MWSYTRLMWSISIGLIVIPYLFSKNIFFHKTLRPSGVFNQKMTDIMSVIFLISLSLPGFIPYLPHFLIMYPRN